MAALASASAVSLGALPRASALSRQQVRDAALPRNPPASGYLLEKTDDIESDPDLLPRPPSVDSAAPFPLAAAASMALTCSSSPAT